MRRLELVRGAAHLRRVPFENLGIHLGEPIVLDEEAIVTKLVDRRRGGFCYEMNGGFAALLDALGFDVTHLEGRVYADGEPGIRFDHLCLQVDLDEGPYLADVGFGASFALPLRLDTEVEQEDPNGTFRIVPTPGVDGCDVLGTPNALYLDGSVSRLYAPALGRHDIGFPMGPILGVAAPD